MNTKEMSIDLPSVVFFLLKDLSEVLYVLPVSLQSLCPNVAKVEGAVDPKLYRKRA